MGRLLAELTVETAITMDYTRGIAICPFQYYHASMTTITCKIPERLHAELEAVARQRRVAKSTIVREALEQRLKRNRKTAAPTAFDLVRSLCGSLHGPVDLSTDPRHMEGFGA